MNESQYYTPVIFCQMLASDWSIGFQPLSFQSLIALLPYWNCELTLWAYRHTPVISCWMLVSDWSIGFRPLSFNCSSHCFHIETVSPPKEPSDMISVPSHSSDFLPNAGETYYIMIMYPTELRRFTHMYDSNPDVSLVIVIYDKHILVGCEQRYAISLPIVFHLIHFPWHLVCLHLDPLCGC